MSHGPRSQAHIDVSVVVPSRNERGTINACLSALTSQDHPAEQYEVLLVDADSTDGTRDIAKEYPVHILDDGQKGPSGARNIGLHASRGRLVAFTDADCIPSCDWVRRIVEVFDERPDVGGVGGALRMPRHGWRGILEDMSAIAHYRGFITSNVAYRRDVLLEVGGFDERLKCAEDWDLACRVRDAGYPLVHDKRPVVVHDPPELQAPPLVYLKKDLWYSRNDVHAHLEAMRRALRGRTDPNGSADVVRAMGSAAWNCTLLAALAGGATTASPFLLGVGVGGAALTASQEVLGAARRSQCDPKLIPPMIALQATRKFFRGAGTFLGLTDLAVERGRGLLARPRWQAERLLPPAARPPTSAP